MSSTPLGPGMAGLSHPHAPVRPWAAWLLGPDRITRSRTTAVLMCALMYGVCCGAAFLAVDAGMMLPFAPKWLLATALPAHLVFFGLVRSGRTRQFRDPPLMIPQNIFALLAISFAYVCLGPQDRGVVLVLVALVVVFGMYTHTAKEAVFIGILAMALLGMSMAVLTRVDPVYYPPSLELLRFELMAGAVPPLVFSAYQLSAWRARLSMQRAELKAALEKVQELATRDSLTGLYNRRHMQTRLEDAERRAVRYGDAFTLALIDLDHFKQLNDHYGHRVGDEALVAFAAAAACVLRETDVIGRWGGEEFLVLLPGVDEQRGLAAMERLRMAMKTCQVSSTAPLLRISFSAGLARHRADAPLGATLDSADRALYRAKASGRDRAMLADVH